MYVPYLATSSFPTYPYFEDGDVCYGESTRCKGTVLVNYTNVLQECDTVIVIGSERVVVKDEQIVRKGGVVIQDAEFEVTRGNITNVRTHEPWNRPSLNVVSYGYRMNGDTGNWPMEWDCKEIRFMLSVHGKNLYYVGLLKLKPYDYFYDWNE